MNSKADRILIIHPEGNIKNNPNLYYFTKELVNNGFAVTVFSHHKPQIYQGELFDGAELVLYTDDKSYNLQTRLKLFKHKFSAIIGVDDGIIDAAQIARILNLPYSFLSYELFFDYELEKLNDPYYSKIKRKSRLACKSINFAIVQDETRKEILSKEYDIELDKIILMPVAASGVRKLTRTKYFHEKLSILPEKNILLYMGWMDEILLKRIVDYTKYMPENWVLVVHSRYKYQGEIPKEFNKDKIYFSLDSPIENIDDLGILLSACDAGFCSYQASFDSPFTGDNITFIGMSSGKTTTFLQYGIPVIVENMNMWDQIVEKENIGFELKNLSDLSKLDTLKQDSIKENCFKYFEEKLDLINYTPAIIRNLKINKTLSKINTIAYLEFIGIEILKIIKLKIISFKP
jgi:hypothetical protein